MDDDLFITFSEIAHLPGCIDLSCPGCAFEFEDTQPLSVDGDEVLDVYEYMMRHGCG